MSADAEHHRPLVATTLCDVIQTVLTQIEKVPGEGILVQVVVGEVQHFQSWQRAKSSGQTAETVHPGENGQVVKQQPSTEASSCCCDEGEAAVASSPSPVPVEMNLGHNYPEFSEGWGPVAPSSWR